MNLDDMKAFFAVIANQSISQAAASRALSQSAISKPIKSFERDLSIMLLNKSVKPPAPTVVGLETYESCLRIGREIAALRTTVALGITQAVCDMILSEVLQRQRENWPDLTLQVTTCWANLISDRLSEGQMDAGMYRVDS